METQKSSPLKKTIAILFAVIFLLSLTTLASSAAQSNKVVSPLIGHEWILISLNNKSVVNYTKFTLTFYNESVIEGSTGCNYYRGEYKVNDAGSLTIQMIQFTQQFCLEPVGFVEQETEYLNLLSNVKKYTTIKDKLIIKTNDGRELIFK